MWTRAQGRPKRKADFEREELHDVEKFVAEKIAILEKRKRWYKIFWILSRVAITIVDLVVVGLVGFALWRTVKDYQTGEITQGAFWGTIGPTIVLCILIISLFSITIFLVFFKHKINFKKYQNALREIQELIIHFNHKALSITQEEKIARIEKIYQRVLTREKISFLDSLRDSVLGED